MRTVERDIQAARRGDGAAFRRLVGPHRAKLLAHCRRILGSDHDADDAVQETLLRAWRGLPGFDRGSRLRPWLYRIATNVCLDTLKKRRTAAAIPLPAAADGDEVVAPPDGPTSPADRAERRESVELAVVAVLQHLPATQRAALVMSDVLGFSARESAELLDTTTTSVYSATQRARKVVERLPAPTEQPSTRVLRDPGLHAQVDRYMKAIDRADVDAIVEMLSADAGKLAA